MEEQLVNDGAGSSHDFLIILLIVCIVGLQVFVFYKAYLKINLFKSILPEANTFKTIKIYVREDQIADLNIAEVYNNLSTYKSKGQQQEKLAKKKKKENTTISIEDELVKYFKMPNNVNVFDVPCVKEEEAMYRLFISSEFPDYAEFELVNGSGFMLERMMDLPDLFINKACTYDGSIPNGISRIEVISKGTAMLENGMWKMENPCKVVFHT
ncbi:hypothetical protein [Myroides marinus]|uniref:hypothetical protein n=1 Tax=Myroides marinus TaxID=703342 RepID=UPI002577B6FB|nr:hypothetical protein [Myroides marinus]MDM1376345.1 hypothetical protein [Myroides marinus]MDM1382061.1 hypothetical protein [Myroides marinus]